MTSRAAPQVLAVDPPPERQGLPLWGKVVVSIVVLLHFFAILTAVTGAGSVNFPAPELALHVKDFYTRPYLHFTFLTNPYRFYAPNPGPTNLVWFRLTYADGSVKWAETPRRKDWPIRMPYQRHLCVVMLFDQMAISASPEDPAVRRLTNEGKIVASSMVRYMARKHGRTLDDGTPNPVTEVAIYNVMHSIMEPWQVQNDWDLNDLRLHTPLYVGTFTADGIQLDAGTTTIEYRVASDMAAYILSRDLYPLFRKYPGRDRGELMDEVGAPPAIRYLLYTFPELARQDEMDRPDLKEVIEQLHGTRGIPAERRKPGSRS
jgi:hypothetical protein